jgi:hypothetical protein
VSSESDQIWIRARYSLRRQSFVCVDSHSSCACWICWTCRSTAHTGHILGSDDDSHYLPVHSSVLEAIASMIQMRMPVALIHRFVIERGADLRADAELDDPSFELCRSANSRQLSS